MESIGTRIIGISTETELKTTDKIKEVVSSFEKPHCGECINSERDNEIHMM